MKESPVLIANEILWRKRKVNTANSGQHIVWWHSVQEHRVSNVCSFISSLSDGTVCNSTGLVMCDVVPPLWWHSVLHYSVINVRSCTSSLWQHIVQLDRVSNVWTCTSSLPHVITMCTGTTNCYIYQTVDTLSWYILMCYFCDFLSLHSLGTSNVFVSSSPQNIVILQIM